MIYYLKKTCGIYSITHIESGKQYIGQSVNCFDRWKSHTTPKKGATGIKGAIMKWGVDAFTFSVLEECKKKELNEREVWWILELCTLSPAGYNLTSGGGQGTFVSDETKEKMSAANMGKTKSEEHKRKLSAANKGKPPSEETKAKLSATLKGRTLPDETKAKMSVSQKESRRRRQILLHPDSQIDDDF